MPATRVTSWRMTWALFADVPQADLRHSQGLLDHGVQEAYRAGPQTATQLVITLQSGVTPPASGCTKVLTSGSGWQVKCCSMSAKVPCAERVRCRSSAQMGSCSTAFNVFFSTYRRAPHIRPRRPVQAEVSREAQC